MDRSFDFSIAGLVLKSLQTEAEKENFLLAAI
jgi:hypothetical protein